MYGMEHGVWKKEDGVLSMSECTNVMNEAVHTNGLDHFKIFNPSSRAILTAGQALHHSSIICLSLYLVLYTLYS